LSFLLLWAAREAAEAPDTSKSCNLTVKLIISHLAWKVDKEKWWQYNRHLTDYVLIKRAVSPLPMCPFLEGASSFEFRDPPSLRSFKCLCFSFPSQSKGLSAVERDDGWLGMWGAAAAGQGVVVDGASSQGLDFVSRLLFCLSCLPSSALPSASHLEKGLHENYLVRRPGVGSLWSHGKLCSLGSTSVHVTCWLRLAPVSLRFLKTSKARLEFGVQGGSLTCFPYIVELALHIQPTVIKNIQKKLCLYWNVCSFFWSLFLVQHSVTTVLHSFTFY
jgi:hypothetical protein